MIDYEFLRFIWWVLVIVLLIGFSVTDGFDMGVTALLPVTGKRSGTPYYDQLYCPTLGW